MATPSEVKWGGLFKPVAYDQISILGDGDWALFRVRPRDDGANWSIIESGDVSTFKFRSFAVTSKVKRCPKLMIEIQLRKLGSAQVTVFIKVIWNCTYLWLEKSNLWQCNFFYDPKRIVLKVLPKGFTALKNSKEFPSGSIPLVEVLPPRRIAQVAAQLTGTVRSRRFGRTSMRSARQVKTTLRPNPEVRTSPYVRASYSDGSPNGVFSTVFAETFRRTHSGSVRTPGFGSLRKSKLPVNGYTCNLILTDISQGAHERKHVNGITYTFLSRDTAGLVSWGPPGGMVLNPNLRNKAIKKLQERSNQDVSNIAVDIVEFRQFNRLVANSATRIVNSVRQLRRGNLVGASDALIAGRNYQHRLRGNPSHSKTLAQNWLELQYGWKPLLTDIVEGREALRRFALKDNMVRLVRASAHEVRTVKSPYTNSALESAPGFPLTVFGYTETVESSTVKYMLRFQASDHLKTLLQQTGFNNPVNLAWELLPFSFVADWFIPIGPYLECLSANQGLTFLDGSETYFLKQDYHLRLDFAGKTNSDPNYNVRLSGSIKRTSISHTRVKLLTFPGVTFPTFKNPVSTTHALNALALLRSAFKT